MGTATPTQKLEVAGVAVAQSVGSNYLTASLAGNFTYDGKSQGHYAL